MVFFLFGIIFKTLVPNLAQFLFLSILRFKISLSKRYSANYLPSFPSTVCIGELVLTVESLEWYKPKSCQLFFSTMELVCHAQFVS